MKFCPLTKGPCEGGNCAWFVEARMGKTVLRCCAIPFLINQPGWSVTINGEEYDVSN